MIQRYKRIGPESLLASEKGLRDWPKIQPATLSKSNVRQRKPTCTSTGGTDGLTASNLTTEEVSERYRGEITVGTLRNWRGKWRIGLPSVKIARPFSTPSRSSTHGIRQTMVVCRASKREHRVNEREGA